MNFTELLFCEIECKVPVCSVWIFSVARVRCRVDPSEKVIVSARAAISVEAVTVRPVTRCVSFWLRIMLNTASHGVADDTIFWHLARDLCTVCRR